MDVSSQDVVKPIFIVSAFGLKRETSAIVLKIINTNAKIAHSVKIN